jgi:hypothetical protein
MVQDLRVLSHEALVATVRSTLLASLSTPGQAPAATPASQSPSHPFAVS